MEYTEPLIMQINKVANSQLMRMTSNIRIFSDIELEEKWNTGFFNDAKFYSLLLRLFEKEYKISSIINQEDLNCANTWKKKIIIYHLQVQDNKYAHNGMNIDSWNTIKSIIELLELDEDKYETYNLIHTFLHILDEQQLIYNKLSLYDQYHNVFKNDINLYNECLQLLNEYYIDFIQLDQHNIQKISDDLLPYKKKQYKNDVYLSIVTNNDKDDIYFKSQMYIEQIFN
jgi:hypothetical protein